MTTSITSNTILPTLIPNSSQTTSITSNTILPTTTSLNPNSSQTVSIESYRRLQEKLAKTEAMLAQQLLLNSQIHAEYVHTRNKLNTSQLANSMLRRLHSNERNYKFHKWKQILDIHQPNAFFEIIDLVYTFCDHYTINEHRICCKTFNQLLPKSMQEISIECQSNEMIEELDSSGLNNFLLTLTSITSIKLAKFYSTETATLFTSGLRSRHLIVMDLSECTIGPIASKELGQGKFPNLEILRVENNHLKSEGLTGLFQNYLGTKRMKSLQLSGNYLTVNDSDQYCDRGMRTLGYALMKYSSTLEILDLSNNGMDDGKNQNSFIVVVIVALCIFE